VVKPRLAATPTPQIARAEFDRTARLLFRRPPHLLRRVAPGDPPLHWITAGPVAPRGVILYFHGGAYFAGSPQTHEGLIGHLSRVAGLRAAAPAYARAPERPAPAAFDDAVAAHARLRASGHAPGEIVLAGDSAGGGLALALLSHLMERDAAPAGLVTFSPWVDLALGSASLRSNAAADPMLPVQRIEEVVGYVLGELRPDDPRVSPLHAAFPGTPPPAMILVGKTEILRDDALRMAERLRGAGGAVRLEQWPEVPHAWPLFDGWFPEAAQAIEAAGIAARSFAEASLGVPLTPPGRS
jgi:acetyl esterase/lipase